MRTLMGAGLAGALLLGTAGIASAGTTTETKTYSATTNWTDTLSFAGATVPHGDVLSKVTLDVSENLNGVVTVSNAGDASSSATGSVSQQDTLTVTLPVLGSKTLVNTAPFQSVDVAPGTTTPFDFSSIASDTYTITTDLSAFIGTWSLPSKDSDSYVSALSGGTTNVGNTNTGGISVTATYYFTPTAAVAEPFSVAMLASGLLSLAMVRRRRRS